jgi:hypothetical protein
VQRHEIELSIGDAVRIGEHTLTIVDIDGLEVSFRIDPSDADDESSLELAHWADRPGK